jgi:signal transduction histidine kinase
MTRSRPQHTTLALLLLAMAAAFPALAAEPVTIVPRSGADWRIRQTLGSVSASVGLDSTYRVEGHPLWIVRANAEPRRTEQFVVLELALADFGLAPVPPDSFDRVSWWWQVDNMETADYVCVTVLDSAGVGVTLGASHHIYDNNIRTVGAPPDQFQREESSIEWAWQESQARNGVGPRMGRVTHVRLELVIPHAQTVLLGPIRFHPGPPPEDPEPAPPRKDIAPGRFFVVDLDGDGLVEVLAPWMTNDKVFRFDAGSGRFESAPRTDILSRQAPYYLVACDDLDADGDRDLVAVNPDAETIDVLHQAGGQFWQAQQFALPLPAPGADLTALALADDDGDGHLDLFALYHTLPDLPTSRCVVRVPGMEKGRFGAPAPVNGSYVPGGVLCGAYHIAPADLNGDGHLDLLVADGRGGRILPGRGDGTYDPAFLALSFQPRGVANGFSRGLEVADVDGDGLLDVYAPTWTNNPEREDGWNFLFRNRGGFQFEDVTEPLGLRGTKRTRNAHLLDLNGRPGLELLLLEESRLVAFDLSDLAARLDGRVPGPIAPTLLTRDPEHLRGMRLVAGHDLDGDGDVELLLSHDGGPVLFPVPESGPAWRLDVRGRGVEGRRNGVIVAAADRSWAIPFLSTGEMAAAPLLLAIGEPVYVTRADGARIGPFTGGPGEVVRVDPGMAGLSPWARALRVAGQVLHAGVDGVRGGLADGLGLLLALVALLVVIATFLWRLLQRRRRVAEAELWVDLLKAVQVNGHTDLRGVTAEAAQLCHDVALEEELSRGNGAPIANGSDLSILRKKISTKRLETLHRVAHTAYALRLGVAKPLEAAIRKIEPLHDEAAPLNWRALRDGFRDLDGHVNDLQRSLAGHFRSNASEVLESVRAGRADSHGVSIDFEPDPANPTGEFPMRADHLEDCLRELLSNALKKEPRPTRIRVIVERNGSVTMAMVVHDNGAPVEVEHQRAARPGSRLGLDLIRTILAIYGGSLQGPFNDEGGVSVRLRVPRYDG